LLRLHHHFLKGARFAKLGNICSLLCRNPVIIFKPKAMNAQNVKFDDCILNPET